MSIIIVNIYLDGGLEDSDLGSRVCPGDYQAGVA